MDNLKKGYLDPNKKLPKRPYWLQEKVDTIKEMFPSKEEEKYISCLHCNRVYHISEFEKNYIEWQKVAIEKGFEEANKLKFCPTNRIIPNEQCTGNPIDFHGWTQTYEQLEGAPEKPNNGEEILYWEYKQKKTK